MTCLGTPEFMAPELYEENYNEKVDIYAFGMCLLEMVTGLMPYHECTSAPQIYKKVLNGELPPELDRVALSNTRAAEFIQACLQHQDLRPSAAELLSNEFLLPNEAEDYTEVRVKFSQASNGTNIGKTVLNEATIAELGEHPTSPLYIYPPYHVPTLPYTHPHSISEQHNHNPNTITRSNILVPHSVIIHLTSLLRR